jgi:tryptophanyl-tRNA synthetase
VLAEFAGQGFGTFKPMLADLAVAKLGAISDRDAPADGRSRRDRPGPGGRRRKGPRRRGRPTLAEVKKIVGFWR